MGYNFYRQNEALLMIISNYEESYEKILDENTILRNYYNETLENYYELREEYEALDERYKELFDDYYELIDEDYKYVIEENKVINIGPQMNVTLYYSIINNNLMELNYSSTGDIFLWVGCTSLNQSYYSRHPTFPKTSRTGIFMVPVSPDLMVFIQNTESYNITTTLSIAIKRTP